MPVTISREERLGFKLEVRSLRNAKRERRNDVLTRCRDGIAARFVNKSGMALYVHKSTRTDRDGDYQVTSFGYDGKPWGHNCAPTFEEAILRCVGASDNSYWNEHGYELVEVTKEQS